MPGQLLNLRDRAQVLDFIAEHMAYLPDTERRKAEERFEDIEKDIDKPSREELADFARRVGRKSWTARRVLAAYLATQNGCDEEWRRVVSAVSSGTAHLLERFRHAEKCESLELTLSHDESDSAFRELERLEIAHVRSQIKQAIWKAKRKELAPQMEKEEARLVELTQRFEALRTLAVETPWIQDEVLTKLERFEDDVYFGGKDLNPDELDEEIKYYREEKELPAEG
jgi:hypothetical protein